MDEDGERINTWKTRPVTASSLLLDCNQIPQQSTFMRAAALNAIGGIDRDLHYVMDFALWLRLSLTGRFKYVAGPVANFRKHRLSKGLASGYAFPEEALSWLSKWDDLDRILVENERGEMFRRKHVAAALYAVIEGKETIATAHLQAALQDGVWPYGGVDALAAKIIRFGGMGGHKMRDSWERYLTLDRALRSVDPARMCWQLRRRVASRYHMLWAFRNDGTTGTYGTRVHLLRGIWNDPRWLRNRSLLYKGMQTFFGRRMADWLRRAARLVRMIMAEPIAVLPKVGGSKDLWK